MPRRILSALSARAYAAAFTRSAREVARFDARPEHERRDLLRGRLLDQIRYFGTRADALPEWREAARIADPDELWRLWPELPILSKDQLRTTFAPAGIAERFGIRGRIGATGGSTGEPTPFLHDAATVRANRSLDLQSRERMGWRPGMPTVAVWGSDRDIQSGGSALRRWVRQSRGDLFVDGYQLTPRTAERTRELVLANAPVAMFGFSSMLDFVARELLASGRPVPAGAVAVAWSGGEMLLDSYVTAFEEAFGTTILNRYGGRELSTMACQYERGGRLRVHRPWLMVEVVDAQGRPAAPGEAGRLLWTSTLCRGTPFLRYDIGDLGSYSREDLDAAGIGALTALHGRTAGVLHVNGKAVNNIFWNHLFKEFEEVRRFQVVLTKAGALRILLTGTRLSDEREAHLRDILTRFLGAVPIDVVHAETLPLTAQGKLVQVLREQ
jgi:phenylacetate-CoA ligase